MKNLSKYSFTLKVKQLFKCTKSYIIDVCPSKRPQFNLCTDLTGQEFIKCLEAVNSKLWQTNNILFSGIHVQYFCMPTWHCQDNISYFMTHSDVIWVHK